MTAENTLLDAVSVDTDGAASMYGGGLSTVLCSATSFGGGTVKVQAQLPDGNWTDITNVSFMASGAINMTLGRSVIIRGQLSGSTSPSGVTLYVSDPTLGR